MEAHTMDSIDPHGVGNWLSPAGLLSFFGALFGLLPIILGVIGGTLAIVWYGVQLWESKTVQHYVANRKAAKLANKIAVLQMQQAAIIGQLKQLGVLIHADTAVTAKAGTLDHQTTTTIETTTLNPLK